VVPASPRDEPGKSYVTEVLFYTRISAAGMVGIEALLPYLGATSEKEWTFPLAA
jgi:hypothetical protein